MFTNQQSTAGNVTFHLPIERTTDRLPDRIGGYAVEGILGRGGMSLVLRVRDERTGEPGAMKVLRSPAASLVARFSAEAMAMASLPHPNVPRLLAFGHDAEVRMHYLVMEQASRGSAADVSFTSGPLPEDLVASWMVQILCALSAAHDLDIVHRDVKSGNILLTGDGRVWLSDFGIAHVPGLALPSAGGRILGSLSFMAPEQRQNPDRARPAMDLYAAGATLYNLATRGSPVDLFLAPPNDLRWEALPESLRPIAIRATRWNPAARYATARAMARDLAPWVPESVWSAQPHLVRWLDAGGAGLATLETGGRDAMDDVCSAARWM